MNLFCFFKIAKKQAHQKLLPWISPIRNQFWYCCSNCDGNELKLHLLWTRLLHHIANDHEYCDHDMVTGPPDGKEWLDPNGSTMKELREKVMDGKLLKSLGYYVRNRHTGMLEVSVS